MISDLFLRAAALLAGAPLGYAFGLLQQAALRRNASKQQQAGLKSGWSLMPGAGIRVAYFLLALVLVQVICPLLFRNGTEWWVSGGVVLGYGWTLARNLVQQWRKSRA